ncbi:hypothetical protein RYX36_022008 [Vicia faba]
MEENEKAALLLLDRASRATRGKRLSKLLDDEVEQDELFWGQDAIKDEEDDNYQEEAESPTNSTPISTKTSLNPMRNNLRLMPMKE